VAGYAYAKYPARPDTIKLSSWRFDTFKKKPFELLDAPPAPKPDSGKAPAAKAGVPNSGGIKIEPAAPAAGAAKPSMAKPSGAAPTLQTKPSAPAPLKAESAKPASK
jgi:hypothetical protein